MRRRRDNTKGLNGDPLLNAALEGTTLNRDFPVQEILPLAGGLRAVDAILLFVKSRHGHTGDMARAVPRHRHENTVDGNACAGFRWRIQWVCPLLVCDPRLFSTPATVVPKLYLSDNDNKI